MNNCRKCGKELTDGRRKICEECAKEEQKEKEERKAQKAEQKKQDESSKKELKEKEAKKEKKLSKESIVVISFVAAIFIVAIIAILCFSASKNVGNTIGNIRNYGYATVDGNYIYYLAPNDDSSAVGIFKIKKNGTGDPKQLFMEDMDIVSINVSNGYVYFIGIGSDAYSDDDDMDNKIYRMKTNGDKLTVINDNEFNNDCYEIYVIDNYVYYIGTDNNIYKMKSDGSSRTLVAENGTGYLGITDKYIIYNVLPDGSEDYTTYIMNLDGTNPRPIIEGERFYSVNIDGNYIYYTNIDKQICKTKIDSGTSEVMLDTTAYNMNLYKGYIYFLNYKDLENEDYTVCLYRIKADGSEQTATNIKELDTYSSFINIVGDWVIYMDSNDTEGFINLVKNDGSSEVCLYLLDYEEYYNSVSSSSTTTTETTESTEETTTTTTDATQTTQPTENTAVTQ